MQNNLLLLILSLCFLPIHDVMAIDCNSKIVINELAKFHGPEWSEVSKICAKTDIKKYLRIIIEKPNASLSNYDPSQISFLYRNAVKSYGHFTTLETGSIAVSDRNFLSDLYKDQFGTIQSLFGHQSDFFKINILEAFANTGSLDALDFYTSILEQEDVLFLQQYAAEYATWVLDGAPFQAPNPSGFGEIFYPNINSTSSERFPSDSVAGSLLGERKEKMKAVLQDMLSQSEKYKSILEPLRLLAASLDGKNTRETQSIPMIESVDNSSPPHSNADQLLPSPLKEGTREIANFENSSSSNTDENQENLSLQKWIMIILLGFFTLVMYLWRKPS